MKLTGILFIFFFSLTSIAQVTKKVSVAQQQVDQMLSDAKKLAGRDTLKARALLQKIMAIAAANNMVKSTAAAYSVYGEMAAMANRTKEALQYVNKAMALYAQLNDLPGVAAMHNNLGNIHESLGDFKQATKNGIAAVKVYEKLKDRAGEAKAMMNLGTVFFRLQDYKTALDYEFKALKIREALGNEEDLMYSYSVIGTMYRYMKKENEALAYHQKSLLLSKKMNLFNNIGIDATNIAETLIALKRFAAAKPYLLDAVPAFEKVGNIRGLRHAYEALSTISEQEGKVADAISWQNKAIAIYQNGDDAYAELALYVNRHRIYTLQKNFSAASSDLQTAESIAKKQNLKDELPNIKQLQLNTYLAMGNTSKAKTALDEFLVYKDSALNSTSLQQINELKTKYETEEKENQLNKSKLLILKKDAEARQKNLWLFGVIGLALIITVAGFYVYQQQQQKHRLKTALLQIEGDNKLQEQRLEISRNLHDNIGSQLTFITSIMDTIKLMSDRKNEAINDRIQKISTFTNEAIIELRDTVWALNSNELSFADLRMRIFNYVNKARDAAENIRFKFEVAHELEHVIFSSTQGINLYRVIQEAVNNAIKYANASLVTVQVHKENDGLQVIILDNGTGFDLSQSTEGNGLHHMKHRMESIGGQLTIQSVVGDGTRIQLSIKDPMHA